MSIPPVVNPLLPASGGRTQADHEHRTSRLDAARLDDWFLVDDGRSDTITARRSEPRDVETIIAAVLRHLG